MNQTCFVNCKVSFVHHKLKTLLFVKYKYLTRKMSLSVSRETCSLKYRLNIYYMYIHFIGFTYFTVISIYCYFWFLYTLHLFLRVAHPVVMVQLEQSKYARTIHIIEVTLVVLLGTVPNIVFSIHSEFHIITFPPIYCGADPEHNFYSTIVPTILVCCATLIMMLFVLYKIHIVSCYFYWPYTCTPVLICLDDA